MTKLRRYRTDSLSILKLDCQMYNFLEEEDMRDEAIRRLKREAKKRGLEINGDVQFEKEVATVSVRSYDLQNGGGDPGWGFVENFANREVAQMICNNIISHGTSKPGYWRVSDNMYSTLAWDISGDSEIMIYNRS